MGMSGRPDNRSNIEISRELFQPREDVRQAFSRKPGARELGITGALSLLGAMPQRGVSGAERLSPLEVISMALNDYPNRVLDMMPDETMAHLRSYGEVPGGMMESMIREDPFGIINRMQQRIPEVTPIEGGAMLRKRFSF